MNETNTRNAQNAVNNKSVNINIGAIQTQAKDGRALAQELSAVADLDNGFAA